MIFSDRIILGTAQLGLNYGVNNHNGKPSLAQSHRIMDSALSLGIQTLDTADLYGDASEVISKFQRRDKFKICSKFTIEDEQNLRNICEHTLQRLKCSSIEGYSFHRFAQLNNVDPEELKKITQDGLVKKWGASLYIPEELGTIASTNLDFTQSPFNILDNHNRWNKAFSNAVAEGKSLTTRSSFLQGLLFKTPQDLRGNLVSLKPYLETARTLANDLSLSITQLSLGYVLSKKEIEGVVIGVDSPEQLEDIFTTLDSIQWTVEYSTLIENINVQEKELLNPGSWKQ